MKQATPYQPFAATWCFWLPRAALIAAVIGWIYWPALRGEFISDDIWYITINNLLRAPAALAKFWFSPGSWVDYYPVHETVLWLQWQLFGENTLGYHLTNVLLHFVNSLLVWRLLSKFGLRLAWLGGLLFALHPVQVDTVAWVVELKNTLSFPFAVLAMCAWIDYDASRSGQDYRRALFWFLLSMLSKISLAPFPVVLLLFAWWKRGRVGWSDVRAAIPFFIIAVVLGLTTFWSGDVYARAAHIHAPAIPVGDFLTRLARAGSILTFYLCASLMPSSPAPLYALWSTNVRSILAWLPDVAWAGTAFWAMTTRHPGGRHLALGLGFFAILLGPFLGFIGISYMVITWVVLHMLYVPIIGIIALIVAGLDVLETRARAIAPSVRIAVVAAVLLWLTFIARDYASDFRSSQTYWTRAKEQDPQNWQPYNGLGADFLHQDNYPEAIRELRAGVALYPEFDSGHYLLALALEKAKDVAGAEKEYREALRLWPDDPNASINLGEIKRRAGQKAEAEAIYRAGLKYAPESVPLNGNLGGLLLESGRSDEAIELYRHAIEINPGAAQLHYDLGSALLQSGRLTEAVDELKTTVDLDPKIAAAHENLGSALAQLHQFPAAIGEFTAALLIDPGYVIARKNVAMALAQSGQIPAAIEQFQLVLQADPNDAQARDDLGKLQQFEQQHTAPAKN